MAFEAHQLSDRPRRALVGSEPHEQALALFEAEGREKLAGTRARRGSPAEPAAGPDRVRSNGGLAVASLVMGEASQK